MLITMYKLLLYENNLRVCVCVCVCFSANWVTRDGARLKNVVLSFSFPLTQFLSYIAN